jgi:adenylate kinase
MRLVMLAPPGAGKGTQSARLAKHFGIEHISSGDLLRQEMAAGTELGRQAKEYVDRGDLVPDDLVVAMLLDRLKSVPNGFVLDGFPRNLQQAEVAEKQGIKLDAVIYLDVSREELLRRLLGRGQGRSDDQEATIRNRLKVYDESTRPLIDYYHDRGLLIAVDGEQPVDKVTEDILAKLQALVSK